MVSRIRRFFAPHPPCGPLCRAVADEVAHIGRAQARERHGCKSIGPDR